MEKIHNVYFMKQLFSVCVYRKNSRKMYQNVYNFFFLEIRSCHVGFFLLLICIFKLLYNKYAPYKIT